MVVFKMMTSATFHAICRPYTLTVGSPFRDIYNGTLLTEAIRKCPHKQFRNARNTERRYFILETSISNLHMNSIRIRHLPDGVISLARPECFSFFLSRFK